MSVTKIASALLFSMGMVQGANIADWQAVGENDNCECTSNKCTLVGGRGTIGVEKKTKTVCVPYNFNQVDKEVPVASGLYKGYKSPKINGCRRMEAPTEGSGYWNDCNKVMWK